MKTITKLSLSLTLLSFLVAPLALAEEKENDKPPIGCRDVGYRFDLKTLDLLPDIEGDSQSMYVLYNTSGQSVNLYQMRKEESARSTFLNHVIGPKQWAVLSTSEKKVKFACSVPKSKSEYGEVIDCAETLRVCEYVNVRYGMNNRGNYWLINSSSKNGAIREIVHYGIIPGA